MGPAPGGGGALGFRHKRVQRVRRLLHQPVYRRAERAFVAEGAKVVGEAIRAGIAVEGVYAAPAGLDEPVVEQAREAGVRVFPLAAGVLERLTSTVTPQPLLAVTGWVDRALDDLPDGARTGTVVVCVDVRDPGNLGTVLRTAEASGMGAVICCEGTVDVYNPKCVRASAGSVFHVPLVAGGAPEEVLGRLGAWGMRRLGSAAGDGVPYDEIDWRRPSAIVLGNEAHGLRGPNAVTGLHPRVEGAIDEWVTVPMTGRAESLNVGMAAAVLCFEASRQRRG